MTIDDFTTKDSKMLFDAIVKFKALNKKAETICYECSYYNISHDYISECTDLGIVTTVFKQNVEMLKKISASRLMFNLSEYLKTNDYNKIDDSLKKIKNVVARIEDNHAHDGNKIYNPDIEDAHINYVTSGYISTGFRKLDETLNDLSPKNVTLITGRSFEGKTTFVRQIIANAIETNNKCLWIMGENHIGNELDRLYQLVIGNDKTSYDLQKINKRYIKIPKPHVLKALKKWHKNKLKIIHKSEARLKTSDELFELMERHIIFNKPNIVIIDNLMSMLTTTSLEKNEKQADFMQKCCDISKLYNLHIALVVHPSKIYKKGNNLEFEDISGTSDLANKADNIIVVRKCYDDKQMDIGIGGYIDVIKNKLWGDTITINTVFDYETQSLVELDDNTNKAVLNKFSYKNYIESDISLKKEFIVASTELPFD